MRHLTPSFLLLIALAAPAAATGVQGNILKINGQPMWPCDIDVVDRQTGTIVVLPNDTTLVNGDYSLTLPNGRYDLTFKPRIGSHVFQGQLLDMRVNNNVLTGNLVLPMGVYLKGKVVGTDGLGVPSTNIRFKTAAGATPTNVQDDGTNADGTFNALVDPSVWNAEFIPAPAQHKAPVQFVGVNLTADVNLGNVVVPNGFVVTCNVTDPTLFPVANASMTVRQSVGRAKVFTPLNNTTAGGVATLVLPAGSYEVIAIPPPGFTSSYATLTQYNFSPSADVTLPTFVFPVGRALSARVVSPAATGIFNADIDVDKMIAPTFPRVETPGDFSDASGNFTVTVASGLYRVTLNPPVATKLLPVRLNNVSVGAAGLNMGTITCPQGHWLDVHVIESGTNAPVAGANIDLINLETGVRLITVDDVTAADGLARIVSDQSYYRVKISPPDAVHDTAYVTGGFRTLNDTSITVVMNRRVTGVGDHAAGGLRFAAPWPNPSRAGASFAFGGQGSGELTIWDVAGRLIATPWHGSVAGESGARWDGRDGSGREVPNGMYFARLRISSETTTRRVVIAH